MNAVETRSAAHASINWPGIAWFLVLCLGLTWSVEIILLIRGIRFATLTDGTAILLAFIMWIPGKRVVFPS